MELQLNLNDTGQNNFMRIHFLRIIAEFEADTEKDISNIGIKTTNIFNPVLNGYCTVSELNDVLKSVTYESLLGYDNVGWFVDDSIV